MAKRLLIAAFAAGLLLAGCTDATQVEITEQQKTPSPVATATAPKSVEPTVTPTQDPELSALLKTLITEELPPISLQLTNNVQRDCKIKAGGCYIKDEAIYLADDYDDFRRVELLAHEYLHHVWFRDSLDDQQPLIEALNTAANNKEGLKALIPPWQTQYVRADGSFTPTELFSYACTGLRSDQMDQVIAERCEKYLNVRELPIYKSIAIGDLIDEVTKLRAEKGLPTLKQNPYAAAASTARADLFTPYSQVPLGEFPDSVTQHLKAGCSPARYATYLTRPQDPAYIAKAIDRILKGEVTSSKTTGIGFATKTFDFIDATSIFGQGTLKVNTTLVVATVCQ